MNKRAIIAIMLTITCISVFSESRQKYIAIITNFNLAGNFMECYPQLAKLQAYDEIPFPEVSEKIAHRALVSKRVTPIIFTFDREIIWPNRYAIHSIPCVDNGSELCHYLSVMPTLGLSQNRVYGPLHLPCVLDHRE